MILIYDVAGLLNGGQSNVQAERNVVLMQLGFIAELDKVEDTKTIRDLILFSTMTPVLNSNSSFE